MSEWDENEVDLTPQYSQEEQDEYFYKIVRFLIDGGDLEEARLLLSCDVDIVVDYRAYADEYDRPFYEEYGHIVTIKAQRKSYDALKSLEVYYSAKDQMTPSASKVALAFDAFLNGPNAFKMWGNAAVDLAPGWRERLHDLVESGGVEVSNQGLGAEKSDFFKIWQNLKFRSATEQKVAEELDKQGIMFFPNCIARLGIRNDRKNKEADFLVCHKGKWGILEVDGPHHSGRADLDHERDRLFKQHGVKVVEHFNYEECFNNTRVVVAKFLSILDKA